MNSADRERVERRLAAILAADVAGYSATRNNGLAKESRIDFRIGINLSDTLVEDEDIYGDGVNVAARLEAIAEPGNVLVSRTVRDHVRDKLDFVFEDLGEKRVKNIARPVHVYRVLMDQLASTKAPLPLPDKPSLAVLPFQNMTGDMEQEYFVGRSIRPTPRLRACSPGLASCN